MKFKYLLINNEKPSLHNTLKDISIAIYKDQTNISRLFKKKHFITIDNIIIYKLNWNTKPEPHIVRFD